MEIKAVIDEAFAIFEVPRPSPPPWAMRSSVRRPS